MGREKKRSFVGAACVRRHPCRNLLTLQRGTPDCDAPGGTDSSDKGLWMRVIMYPVADIWGGCLEDIEDTDSTHQQSQK